MDCPSALHPRGVARGLVCGPVLESAEVEGRCPDSEAYVDESRDRRHDLGEGGTEDRCFVLARDGAESCRPGLGGGEVAGRFLDLATGRDATPALVLRTCAVLAKAFPRSRGSEGERRRGIASAGDLTTPAQRMWGEPLFEGPWAEEFSRDGRGSGGSARVDRWPRDGGARPHDP